MTDKISAKIRPLEDRIVVEAVSEETKTVSGIIIPDTISKDKPQRGKVLAVGTGRIDNNGKHIPMEVKEGDIILFTKYGPTEVKVEGKALLILNQSDVLAVID